MRPDGEPRRCAAMKRCPPRQGTERAYKGSHRSQRRLGGANPGSPARPPARYGSTDSACCRQSMACASSTDTSRSNATSRARTSGVQLSSFFCLARPNVGSAGSHLPRRARTWPSAPHGPEPQQALPPSRVAQRTRKASPESPSSVVTLSGRALERRVCARGARPAWTSWQSHTLAPARAERRVASGAAARHSAPLRRGGAPPVAPHGAASAASLPGLSAVPGRK